MYIDVGTGKLIKFNLCVQKTMYECSSGPLLVQQEMCGFFQKSMIRNCCMFRHFDTLCDCIAAHAAIAEDKNGNQ